ncbi:hypothetical protein E2C01_041627 [Portunus trituberculatus]|uniref:Uncharacterized protein n=1 Tax=Portunus trituberculatus TaxID=210409 RepID=A0A5B7FSD7_PORTR|nr:hypothetical protein [Portunus trituberculatus]
MKSLEIPASLHSALFSSGLQFSDHSETSATDDKPLSHCHIRSQPPLIWQEKRERLRHTRINNPCSRLISENLIPSTVPSVPAGVRWSRR